MRGDRYKLEVRLIITREQCFHHRRADSDEHGDDCRWQPTQERLSIDEDVNLGGLDFASAMGVMGRMHEAVTQITRPADADQ